MGRIASGPLVGAIALGAAILATPAAAEVKIQELKSPGGQAFWLVEEPSIPIVAVEIGFRTGSRTDPAEKTGLTNFVISLMTEGSGDLDAVAWSKRADAISARIGFSARTDRMAVSARFLVETLDESVELLATTMAKPRFDPEPVARVRAQILSSIAQSETNPDDIASQTWYQRAFPGHPYGRDRRGKPEAVKAFAIDDFRAAHNRLLTTANAHIVIVGAVDAERAGKMVDRMLAGLPKGTPTPVGRARSLPPPGVHVVKQDVPQSVAIFGHRGLKRSDKDFIAAYVMNYVLGGGGLNSRLAVEVRVKRGLAYSVYSYLAPYAEAELFLGGVQTANARIAKSIEVIRAEWARMAAEGPTEEELKKAKTYLTGSFPLQFDSNAKIAGFLLFVQRERLGIDYINKRNALVEAVTIEDVRRVAARLLDPKALSIVVVGKPVGL